LSGLGSGAPHGLDFIPFAVPEPSTWAMMLVGFGGLGFAAYRTSAKKRAALPA
jgi:PEP-CTERM motif